MYCATRGATSCCGEARSGAAWQNLLLTNPSPRMPLLQQLASDAVSKFKADVSLAEIVLASVCMFAAEPETEEALADWLDSVEECGASPTTALGLSGCESDGLRMVGALTGRYGIGCKQDPCGIIARACNAVYPGAEWSASLVIKYQKLVTNRTCPGMHHGNERALQPKGARLLTVGGAKAVAQFILAKRSEVAVALHDAREGGGDGGGSGGGVSEAQREQRRDAAASAQQGKKRARAAANAGALAGTAELGPPSLGERSVRRGAAGVAAAVLGSAGSPCSAAAIFQSAVSRGDVQGLIKKGGLALGGGGSSGAADTTNVIAAYALAKAQKNARHALAMLSLLCASRKPHEVLKLFSCEPCDGDVHFHESGEGKNEVDSFCARSKAKVQRWLNIGKDCEVPAQLQAALEHYEGDGEWTMTIEHDFSREERDEKANPVPGVGSYSTEVHHVDGSVTFYEAGRFGKGVTISAEDLMLHDQHGLGASGTGVAVTAADTSTGAKLRQSKGGLEEQRESRAAMAASAAAARGEGAGAKAAFARDAAPAAGMRCQHCRAVFLSENGQQQHKCREARAPRTSVKAAVAQQCRADLAAEDTAAHKLRLVTAAYAVPRRCPKSGGWLGMAVGAGATVESVTSGGATDLLMTVGEGWRVVSAGGTAVSGAATYGTAVGALCGKKAEVVFERETPQMPHRGWARKAFSKKARTAVTSECRAYLDAAFASAAEHGLKARAAAVFKAMGDGGLAAQHRVGITVKYIESLFSRRSRAAKDAALRAIIKAEAADEEEEEGEDEEMEDADDVEGEDSEDDDGWGSGVDEN